MNRSQFALLTELLAQPTAPFREDHVIAVVTHTLDAARVPYFLDPVGNVVVGCRSPAGYRQILRHRAREPLRLFIAHMDHPGFHGVRWLSPTRLAVRWHGGSPIKHLAGAPVWVADASGYRGEGRLAAVRLLPSKRALARATVVLTEPWAGQRPAADSLYGAFRFRAPVWRAGPRLYTKAADDLVGVFAIVATAMRVFARRRSAPFLGLLTRAEEVGFVGAVGHLELGWLGGAQRPVICVSLETSRTLPQALIGKGPVVRLGDRRTVFDPGALRVLSGVAERALPRRHQRRIMDGGTCEATAALAYGVPAIGLSVPLGNYHNQGYEGGPDCRAPHGPAPEFVHLDDIDGLLAICRGLMRAGLPWALPWRDQRAALQRNLRRYRRLLAPPA